MLPHKEGSGKQATPKHPLVNRCCIDWVLVNVTNYVRYFIKGTLYLAKSWTCCTNKDEQEHVNVFSKAITL